MLEADGYLILPQNSDVRHSRGRGSSRYKSGTPDLIGCSIDGRFIGIEVKNGHKRLTKEQINIAKQITNRGGIFYIVSNEVDILAILANNS